MRLVEEAVPRRVEVPVLSIAKRVVVAAPFEVEPIAKSVLVVPKVVVEVKMERRANGEVVPIPTRPTLSTRRSVLVDEPITNCGAEPRVPVVLMER